MLTSTSCSEVLDSGDQGKLGVARREMKINIYQKQCSLVHIPSYPYIGAAMISKFSKDFGASIVAGWKVKKGKCVLV